MAGIYYDFASILSNAGCKVGVNSINAGWERRARSSGGFPSPPLAVWWHHTASKTAVNNDLQWQCHSCPDKPVGNMLLDRTGTFWPVAGGASNCAGKGGPASFSRGTVPADSGNTRGFQIECANNGVGEVYPQAQIDAFFRASNALNAFVGNRPSDVISHNVWAPSRKIDPARNTSVQGPWVPRSTNSSGTWNLDDIRNECGRRAGASPGPGPGPGPQPPDGDDDMKAQVIKGDGSDSYWAWDGVRIGGIPSLEWVSWGFEAGLYQNTEPVLYPQGFIDQLVATQSG
jgi:hypothetical protein